MTTRVLRRQQPRTSPSDAEHRPVPYAEVQRDVGSSLFLGAIVLVAMMALIVFGLV